MKSRFRFEKLDVYLAHDESNVAERDIEPLFDCMDRLAKRIVSLNRTLNVVRSKTPFNRKPLT